MPFSSALTTGIQQSAEALGISPVDLATVISYETAGTFDPTKRGPTTRWGTHRGFIQFGEPQAAKYGVNWDDPLASQLGPDGAVVRYLRDAGVTPGTSLEDLYSAINAGHVGRPNASDSASGGAPGTVRDKVLNQMSGHIAKAKSMFPDSQTATSTTQADAPTYQAHLPDTNLMEVPKTPDILPGGTPAPTKLSSPTSGPATVMSAYRRQLSANTPGRRRHTSSAPIIFKAGA